MQNAENYFWRAAKKIGLEVEEEPIYGGKKYLEKQEYIIEMLNADIKYLYDTIDTWQKIGEKLQAENERLTQGHLRIRETVTSENTVSTERL